MSAVIDSWEIRNMMLNNSTAKHMYSFPREERFFKLSAESRSRCQTFYDLPSLKSKRAASWGKGKKYLIIDTDDIKLRLRYNVPYLNLRGAKESTHVEPPKYTFGVSREHYINFLAKHNKITASTGPANYNTRSRPGTSAPKYTMRMKPMYQGKGFLLNVPGPGEYKVSEMNQQGIYVSSRTKNVPQSEWSYMKEQRFNLKEKNKSPGPSRYEVKGWIDGKGFVFNSKFRSGTSKSMSKKFKSIFDIKDSGIPGPGAYSTFSEFSMYKPTIVNCEKKRMNSDANIKFKERNFTEHDSAGSRVGFNTESSSFRSKIDKKKKKKWE